MADHLIDHLQHGSLAVLRRDNFRQPIRREILQDRERFTDRHSMERLEQFGSVAILESAANSQVPLPNVRLAPDAPADPLTDVAAKVQNQIANGVLSWMGPIPDLVGIELQNANVDIPGHLRQLVGRNDQKQFAGHESIVGVR
jgi:hypothetical protein